MTVQEEGHAYVFISNESPTGIDIYFDDVTMIYTPSNVLQYNEYYPYACLPERFAKVGAANLGQLDTGKQQKQFSLQCRK